MGSTNSVQIKKEPFFTVNVFVSLQSSFPEGSLVAMLVVVGEVRVSMDPANPDCYELCTSFRAPIMLKAGDVCECVCVCVHNNVCVGACMHACIHTCVCVCI